MKKSMLRKSCVLIAAALALVLTAFADETISANVTLTADTDWRDKGTVTIPAGVTVNLNGHSLKLAGLAGEGTSIDLTTTEASRASSATTFLVGSAATAFNNNFLRSSGRILVEKRNLPLVIDYDFGEGTEQVIDQYKVYCGPIQNYTKRCPKAWTFEGSNDKTTWTVLDSRSSETGWTIANSASECRTKTFENTTPYRYYRFKATAAQDDNDGYLEIVQLEYLLRSAAITSPLPIDLTTTDSSRATTTTTLAGGGRAANAFNDNFTRGVDGTHRIIMETKNLPLVIDYDFGEGNEQAIDQYKVYCGPILNYTKRCPKAWTFEGSNDKTTWTVLDSRTSETGWSAANSASECRTKTFENTTPYRYYRFKATAAQNDTDGYLEIVQLEYFSSASVGKLHLDIPQGVTVDNRNVTITDGVRLVKEGAGTFVASMVNQTYCGGTHVVAGTFKCGAGSGTNELGDNPSVLVETGAVFDVNGWKNIATCGFTLAGGTLTNGGSDFGVNEAQISKLKLTADSFVSAPHYLGMISPGFGVSTLDLGGHTLYLSITNLFRLTNTEAVSPGTIKVSGGKDALLSVVTAASNLKKANLELEAKIAVDSGLSVGDIRFDEKSVGWDRSQAIRVFGSLTLLNDAYSSFELQDGATLDLSKRTKALDIVSTLANQRITFVPGATITVKLNGRTAALGDCLVSWDAMTRPGATVSFKFDDETAQGGIPLVMTDSGIFFGADPNSREAEYAVWTGNGEQGNLSDPDNWSCTNAAGRVIDRGLPGVGTILKFTGAVDMQIPNGSQLLFSSVEFDNCRLGADCDWRGLSRFVMKEGSSIDLNGHELKLAGFAGSGTITNPPPVDLATDSSRASSATTFLVGSAATAFNNNFLRSSGRILVEKKNLPLVIDYDFGEGAEQAIDQYKVYCGPIQNYTHRCPKAWTFEGSNDKTTWKVLDSCPSETGWSTANLASECRTKTFENTTPYRYYRFKVTAAQDTNDGYLEIVQLEYFSTTTAGKLCLDIPEGVTVDNRNVAFGGNLRLVKEGAGTFVASRVNQTYCGGTHVVAGTFTCGAGSGGNELGNAPCVVVGEDAVFDVNGWKNISTCGIALAGGTLTNGSYDFSSNEPQISKLKLTADSHIVTSHNLGIVGVGNGVCTLDLGGHTLKLSLKRGVFRFANVESMSPGAIEVLENADLLSFVNGESKMQNVRLDLKGRIALYNDVKVGGLRIDAGTVCSPNPPYKFLVYDKLSLFNDAYISIELQDGTTLDLSERTTALDVVSTLANQQLTFVPDATVTLDIGNRQGLGGKKVVAWNENEKPENLQPQQFKVKSNGGKYRVVFGDDGIYLKSGLAIYVR